MSLLEHLIKHGVIHLSRELPKWIREIEQSIDNHKIKHIEEAKSIALAHGASRKKISTYKFDGLKTKEDIYIYTYIMRVKQYKSYKWHCCSDSSCTCRQVMTGQAKTELRRSLRN